MRNTEEIRKKGNLSIQVVIVAILGFIVLVVLMFVFKDQITKAAGAYFDIGSDATDGAQGKRCVTIVSAANHKCVDKACEEGWQEIHASGEEWKDCDKDKKCCEKI